MTLGDRIRRFFEPSKPWNIMFLLAIGVLIGYMSVINARTIRDEAVRTAEAQSSKNAAVARCMESRPILMKFSRHVQGVNDGFVTLVTNSRKTIAQTPTSDPEYGVRVANLHRLLAAMRKVAALPGFPVPTKAKCRAMGN